MQQGMRYIDHEQRQVECIGERDFLDVHEIFQPPMLFGIPEIKLDLEAQAVVIDELVKGKLTVTAEQVHVGEGTRLQVDLGDDNHIEWLRKSLVQHLRLINVGLNIFVNGSFHEIFGWHVAIVDLGAVHPVSASATVRTIIRKIQSRITTEFGDQV